MKKLLVIFIVIGLTLVSALVTPWLMNDPGYVYMRFGGYEVEMRFIVAFGLVVFFVVLFWAVVFLLKLPKNTLHNLSTNRSRKSFAKGLLALSEGKWKQAEKQLLISTKNSPTPELGFMAAARAAIAQNRFEKAFDYLDNAENNTDNPLTVDLTRCELWLKINEYKKATDLLNRILQSYPNNPRALFLMTQASQETGQWQRLREILPKVKKLKIINNDKFEYLTEYSISQQLDNAETKTELQVTWDSLNKVQKQAYKNIHSYAQTGLKLKMYQQVASLTEGSLTKELSDPLLEIWSQLDIDNQDKIKIAEKWLGKNPKNAILLQILGQLCLQNKLWGKSQTYLQQSLKLEPSSKTFKLLAQYFDAVGEPDNALEAYRQAENPQTSLLLLEDHKQI